MLTYLNYSKIESVTNNNVAHIHECVTHVKQSAEVRERYMTIGEMMDRSKAEGLAEGQQKGICKALLSILEELGGVSEELPNMLPGRRACRSFWRRFKNSFMQNAGNMASCMIIERFSGIYMHLRTKKPGNS